VTNWLVVVRKVEVPQETLAVVPNTAVVVEPLETLLAVGQQQVAQAVVVSTVQAAVVERLVSGHRMEVEAVHGVHILLAAVGQLIVGLERRANLDVVMAVEALRP
jgi:hypothetical protein